MLIRGLRMSTRYFDNLYRWVIQEGKQLVEEDYSFYGFLEVRRI